MTLEEMFGRLSPEEIQQMLSLGDAPKRDAMLEDQLKQAQGLMDTQPEAHSTGLGALLGGLGDVGKVAAGAFHARALREQQAANLKGDTAARMLALQSANRSVMNPGDLNAMGQRGLTPPPMPGDAPPPMPSLEPDGDEGPGASRAMAPMQPATAATINALRHGAASAAVGAPQGVPLQQPVTPPKEQTLADALRGASASPVGTPSFGQRKNPYGY